MRPPVVRAALLRPAVVRARAVVGLFALVAGCGGSRTSVREPQPELDAGAQCLRDAAAPREVPPGAPSRITLSHILVRHKDLRAPLGAVRTREQACLRALEAHRALLDGGTFDEVAGAMSDAKTSSLGEVSRDDLSRSVSDAAFGLEPDELSYVVESDRGFHILLRER